MKWVTRERVRMDRVACAWLIRNFIDESAEFSFVSPKTASESTKQGDSIPFVIPGAELARRGEKITFDVMLEKYNLTDPALLLLAGIVRAADIGESSVNVSEAAGVRAIVHGFFLMNLPDDHALNQQYPLFDALYRYCQDLVSKRN